MEPIRLEHLEHLRNALARYEVEHLFLGKTAAILQGFPDTTQDADLFIEKTADNGRKLTGALRELGFAIGDAEAADIARGRDFIQLRNGPFDVDLVFAPDGIERYEDARQRGQEINGYRVCSMKDVIESKRVSNRAKDRESLPRLRDFAAYLERRPHPDLRPLPPRAGGRLSEIAPEPTEPPGSPASSTKNDDDSGNRKQDR